MNAKSTKVKKFIKDAGVNDQLFVFAGSNTSNVNSNSTQSGTDLWTQSDFSVRVGQNSLTAVVPYIKWIAKRPYKIWSSTSQNTGNFYAYNDQNGYVYLCISDNIDNRKDFAGQNVSNIRPTHTAGIQRYADGYEWKPLYKITALMERFVSSSWLPVVSFENFDGEPQQTQLEQTQRFCTGATTGQTGFCAIYAKTPLSTDDDAGTIEYETGDLFTVANSISCSDCNYLTKENDRFKSAFYLSSESIPNNISILDNYQMVGQMIASGELGIYSPYYYLYTINENDELSEGSIISAFIDLSGYTTTELISTVSNPAIKITSGSGSGGEIRLKTYPYGNNFLVYGIEVVNRGSGYRDIHFSIDSSILPNVDTSLFVSNITINIDTIDGLGFDPVDVLDSQHVMIDARMEKRVLEDAGIILPTEINFFGLIKNPFESATGANIIAGSNKNKKIDVVYRTTIKAQLLADDVVEVPLPEEEIEISYPGTDLSPTLKIGGVKPIDSTTAQAELRGVRYEDASSLVGLSLDSTSGTSTITQILEKPIFVQFTGNILTTTKQNVNLPISDVDSVIIRINMVQGM